MKFLFLVGVEGTGHHMIRAVLRQHVARPEVLDEGRWLDLLTDHWDPSKRFELERQGTTAFRPNALSRELASVLGDYEVGGARHLFAFRSFPFRQPRDPLRRPDIIELYRALPDTIDLRCLVLSRDEISATYSAYRRGFTDNIHLQARIAEANFSYIERQCGRLPTSVYRVLRFEEFIDDPQRFLGRLADWWEIEPHDLEAGLEELRRPLSRSEIPEAERAVLEEFFSEERCAQWRDFYAANRL